MCSNLQCAVIKDDHGKFPKLEMWLLDIMSTAEMPCSIHPAQNARSLSGCCQIHVEHHLITRVKQCSSIEDNWRSELAMAKMVMRHGLGKLFFVSSRNTKTQYQQNARDHPKFRSASMKRPRRTVLIMRRYDINISNSL